MTMFHAIRYVRDELPAELDSTAHHVALVLATFASSATGIARPSLRQLAAATRMHTSTIARAITRLEAAGVLEVRRPDAAEWHRRQSSEYRFVAVDNSRTARTVRAVSYPQQRASSARTARTTRALGVFPHLEERASAHDAPTDDPRGVFLPGSGWARRA